MREVIIAHPLCDEQNHVVAADFVFLKPQHALRIGSDTQLPRVFNGNVIRRTKFLGARGSLIFRPSNSSIVVVPTSHAPMQTGIGAWA